MSRVLVAHLAGAIACRLRELRIRHEAEPAQRGIEHRPRHSEAARLCLGEKVRDIDAHEVEALVVTAGTPVAEAAIFLLPRSQHGDGVADGFLSLGFFEAEVRIIAQHEPGKCAAGDLLAASVRILAQVCGEPACESERRRGDDRLALCKLRVEVAGKFHVMRIIAEPAALNDRDARRRGPHRHRRALLGAFVACACGKFQLRVAECVLRLHAEAHGHFLALRDDEGILRRLDDLDPAECLRSDGDLIRHCRAFELVCHGERCGELVARCREERRIRREHKRAFHDCLFLRDADRVGCDGGGHDVEPACEIIRHIVEHLAALRAALDDAAPKHHGRGAAALERIQAELQLRRLVTVAAKCLRIFQQ